MKKGDMLFSCVLMVNNAVLCTSKFKRMEFFTTLKKKRKSLIQISAYLKNS